MKLIEEFKKYQNLIMLCNVHVKKTESKFS